MNLLLKKMILLYWVLLITTIGSHTSAANDFSQVPGHKAADNTILQFTPPSIDNPKKTPLEYTPEMSLDTTTELIPEKISIPAIGMESPVSGVGVAENGEMEVPADINEIGWFEPGVIPGGKGNSVLAGHLDGKGEPGAFYHLGKLKAGDEVVILGSNGKRLTFQVLAVESYYTENAPLEKIFGYHSDSRLNLITCSGTFNNEVHEYEERLVVYTELASIN